MVDLKCMNCGKDFKVYPSRLKNGTIVKTCSTKCKFELMKVEETDSRKYVKCDCCGKEYLLYNYRANKTKKNYCSYECMGKDKSLSVEKTCEHCGKTYYVKKSNLSESKHCSMDCRKKSKTYRGKTQHKNFYDTEKWKKLRKECIKRDESTCRSCGIKDVNMDVHHIISRNDGGPDELENLICVCKSCHAKLDSKLYNLKE